LCLYANFFEDDILMRVLFVHSGNSVFGINPIIKNQAEALVNSGIEVQLFPIKGKGLLRYLSSAYKLHRYLRANQVDIIHAHFGLSGLISKLGGRHPTIVSLMGSELYENKFWRIFYRYSCTMLWDGIIVKTMAMKRILGKENIEVIPNGVNLDKFKPMNRAEAREKLGWNEGKYVLFVSVFNSNNFQKNSRLAEESMAVVNEVQKASLISLHNIDNSLMPTYYSAADCLLITSRWEGSPNAVKEAMACNCPIVSTPVGDVPELFDNVEGNHITDFNKKDIAAKILQVISKSERTRGREKILQLSDKIINKRIIDLYKKVSKYE
jgi:teichuronic acid biosynthesis glycosyltransferase TuaC